MTCYDLHCHSFYSDGELTPQQLLQHAKAQEIDVLALTDHDTMQGYPEAKQAADELGIQLVPGVEISVLWQQIDIHIVGLRVDPDNPMLQEGLAYQLKQRQLRSKQIAENLEKLGFENTLEAAKALAGGEIVGRPHFAQVLINQGHVRDMKSAFKKYLKAGMAGYASTEWVDLPTAIKWITTAGGQAVIAHPARYRISKGKLRKLLDEFQAAGGVGLEVATSAHTQEEIHFMARLCENHGFLASVGSDYHGPNRSWGDLGRLPKIPENCTPIWETW